MHKKIAISGKMGAGKSTLSRLFQERYGYKMVSIGSSIKEVATWLIERNDEEIHCFLQMLTKKEDVINLIQKDLQTLLMKWDNHSFVKDEFGHYLKTEPYRLLLQEVATYMREKFGQNVWVDYLIEKTRHDTEGVIVDDVRLKVGKKALEQNGFIVVRLDIEEKEQKRRLKSLYGKVDEKALLHITEVDLDEEPFLLRKDVSHDSPEEVFAFFQTALQEIYS